MASPDSTSAQQGEVTRRAGIVVLGTLGSRLLGAARDAVIAASFALGATDAFFVAWTIPNTLRRLLGEGAVSAAFIPVFTEIKEKSGEDAARDYTARFGGALATILVLVSALGVLTAPLWASLYGAGYRDDPETFGDLVLLTRLLFPYIFFAGLAALGMGALNAMGRFAVPAFAPALLNVALIAAPWLLVPVAMAAGQPAIVGLALGALLGGALQVLAQLPALRRVGMRPRLRPDFKDPQVRRSLALMAPLVLGTGVHQLNILLSRLLASFLPMGSQSFLYYGQRVVEIPQGMFAVAIASAALPSLAAQRSRGDQAGALSTFRYSLRLTLFVALPASAAIAALAEPIVGVLFGRGAFGPEHAQQTAACLVWLAAGVWAVAAIHPVVRMYHACGDTRTPVWASAVNLAVFLGVSLLGMGTHGHVAIAMGTSAAAAAQLLLLVLGLRRRVGPVGWGEVAASAARCALAGAGMGAVVGFGAGLFDWRGAGTRPLAFGALAVLVVAGASVYAAASQLLGSPEFRSLVASLRRRRRRS